MRFWRRHKKLKPIEEVYSLIEQKSAVSEPEPNPVPPPIPMDPSQNPRVLALRQYEEAAIVHREAIEKTR